MKLGERLLQGLAVLGAGALLVAIIYAMVATYTECRDHGFSKPYCVKEAVR